MHSLCVYCGSGRGRDARHADGARELAAAMARRNLRLVYRGASVGLMGVLADEMLAHGGEVVGVMPEALVRKEVAHQGLSEFHVTTSMHERKMLMAELADGFVALPGGIGTLEELFEIWTWAQLGFHPSPCGLLNVCGYYDGLITFLDHARGEGFVALTVRDMLIVDSTPEALLTRFDDYVSPRVDRWVGRGEV